MQGPGEKDSFDGGFSVVSALSSANDSAVVFPITDGTSSGDSDGVSDVGILAPGWYSVML